MEHRAIEIDQMQDEAIEIDQMSGWGSMGNNDFRRMTSRSFPLVPNGPSSSSPPLSSDMITHSLGRLNFSLEESRKRLRTRGGRNNPSCSIFKLPATLCGINRKAEEPEIVSIGPYHRGQAHLLDFEEHKWFFLDRFLLRTRESLRYYIEQMGLLERFARECYSEPVVMSPGDFVEMMLVDGCFIVQLLRHLGRRGEDPIDENDPIFSQPWLIPVVIRDLLKLENQLPFFIIEFLFITTKSYEDTDLSILALEVFNLTFARPGDKAGRFEGLRVNHLLHLFHLSLIPSRITYSMSDGQYRPSDQSIQSASQLRPSGIKFKSSKANSILDISFQNRVLEIPSITIDDFMSTLLVNCVALEQCQESGPKYITDYVSFMSCLIDKPKDVSLLCSDGIVTRFSQDDIYVVNLFNKLGKNLVFNVHNCYLSEQFRDLERYYNSNWATMLRTYFNSPWSCISVFSAFLIILLTAVQTVFAVISYKWH